jgi:hypothetical protein
MSKEDKCYLPVNDQKLIVSFEEDKKIAAFWNMHNEQDVKDK